MPNKSVREIIKEIYYDWADEDSVDKGNFDDDIDQALQAIRQAIKDEMPRRKADGYIECNDMLPRKTYTAIPWSQEKIVGYNQARTEDDTALDKLFGIKNPCCWKCGKVDVYKNDKHMCDREFQQMKQELED